MAKKESNTTIKENQEEREIREELYELGYHIVPTVAEEALVSEVAKVRDALESLGGVSVADGMPKLVNLSYSISKVLSSKKVVYETAYFGWMKFRLDTEKVASFYATLRGNEVVLRFLIVKTEEEKAIPPPRRMKFFDSVKQSSKIIKKPEVKEEKKGEVSEAEIDKVVEELIVE